MNGLLRGIKVLSVEWKLLSLCCFDGHHAQDCYIQHLLSTFKKKKKKKNVHFLELSAKMAVENNTQDLLKC